jgi:tRNA-guanine family transglycosylase
LWLGQSARTTVVTRAYPALASARWMASLGDAIHRPRMLETVFGPMLKDRLAITGPLMLDSGGFTMMMRQGRISIAGAARAFGATAADVVVSLDHPPLGDDSEAVRRDKYAHTLANYAALHQEPIAADLAPVVHGVTTDELRANCDAIATIEPTPPWVCLGGLVPLLRQCGQLRKSGVQAREHLHHTITLVRNRFPHSHLHVLGVGSPRTVAAAYAGGADSVDSIGWRRAAGFGTIFLPGGTERFVADRERKRATSRWMLTEADRHALGQCACPVCHDAGEVADRIAALAQSYLPRAAHNAWVLLGEADAASDERFRSRDQAAPQKARAISSSVREGAKCSS